MNKRTNKQTNSINNNNIVLHTIIIINILEKLNINEIWYLRLFVIKLVSLSYHKPIY